MSRIIDRDIESYTAFLEAETDMLRRCVPSREPHYKARIELLQTILGGMKAYRSACDANVDRGSFHVILSTQHGRTGTRSLTDPNAGTTWAYPTSGGKCFDPVVLAKFELRRPDGQTDVYEVDGDAWRELTHSCDFSDLASDCVAGGASIESALRAQMDVFDNHYEHQACGTSWVDTHSCGCDDECPSCGTAVSPIESVKVAGLTDDVPARFISDLESMPEEADRPAVEHGG